MTRRTHSATRRNSTTAPNTSSGTPTADVLEERVVAFAEQLGRIAGTVQAKAAGWMDGDALKKELARVRDGAADLLQRLTPETPAVAENRPTGGAAPQTKPSTQWRHRRRAREETSFTHADRSRREPCGQSGGQNARGEDDGQDTPAPRARLEFSVFVRLETRSRGAPAMIRASRARAHRGDSTASLARLSRS